MIPNDEPDIATKPAPSVTPRQAVPVSEFTPIPSEPATPFLYLLQTESCIPSYLSTVDVIGSTSACQYDVLIFSFKEVCKVTPPVHIEYISVMISSTVSWARGRNMLFEAAMRRRKKYLYYIFIDDDIVLKRNDVKTTAAAKAKNNWRIFEDFLLRVQPAIGAVDASNNLRLPDTYRGRKRRGCVWAHETDYLPASRYDHAFNAFHYQAIKYLLPYPCRFDNISWYLAELQVEVKCEMIFAGQSVLHTKLVAGNDIHRPYLKVIPKPADWKYLVDAVKQDLPELKV